MGPLGGSDRAWWRQGQRDGPPCLGMHPYCLYYPAVSQTIFDLIHNGCGWFGMRVSPLGMALRAAVRRLGIDEGGTVQDLSAVDRGLAAVLHKMACSKGSFPCSIARAVVAAKQVRR